MLPLILAGTLPMILALCAGSALAGPNREGILLCHVNEALVYTTGGAYCGLSGLTACEDVDSRVDGGETAVVFIVAAFPVDYGAEPRLSGVTFGIDYDPDVLGLVDWDGCGDLEVPTNGWPEPGEGTSLIWREPRTGAIAEVYWFAAYAQGSAATQLKLIPNPTQGAFFGDDDIPATLDPIAFLGSMGFNTDGDTRCFDQVFGACCFPAGECAVLSETICVQAGGDYQGPATTCDPDPCSPTIGACCIREGGEWICEEWTQPECELYGGIFAGPGTSCEDGSPCPTPVREVTWGRLKRRYR
jgi:hypothetical protein